jgi:hypothetical protein
MYFLFYQCSLTGADGTEGAPKEGGRDGGMERGAKVLVIFLDHFASCDFGSALKS